MARPGPKPNNDHLISERLDVMERLLHHVLGDQADETANRLLRELAELRTRQAHRCEVCTKSYSDAKGLRRHILTADERHAALAGRLSALACRWCGRGYAKREQVTKHENTCAQADRGGGGGGVSAPADREGGGVSAPADREGGGVSAPADREGGGVSAQTTRPAVAEEPEGGGRPSLPEPATAVRLPPMRLVDPASARAGCYAEDDL